MDSWIPVSLNVLKFVTIIISFQSQTVPYLANGSSFNLASVVLLICPPFFKQFLTFWENKMFQVYFAPSIPQLWNQPFFQEALVLYSGKWYYI